MPIEKDIPIVEVMRFVRTFTRDNKFGKQRDGNWGSFNYTINDAEAEKCAEGLTAFGFTGDYRNGISKVCFPHESEWVLKLPLIRGFQALTTAEVKFMMSVPLKYRRFFPKNVRVPGAVFQEKCPPDYDRFYMAESRGVIDRIQKALNLCDLHYDNIGFNKRGTLKVIDAQTRAVINRIRDYKAAA